MSAKINTEIGSSMAPIGRRRLLRWTVAGLAGAGALAGGVVYWRGQSSVDDLPLPPWVKHLTHQEFFVFKHALGVLLPMEGSGLVPVDERQVMGNIDEMFGLFAPAIRKQIKDGLALFDYAPIVSGWHGKRFVDLANGEAVRFFDNWSEGNMIQRALATTVKKVVYVSYWRDPYTWGPVQFDGPVSDKWGIPSLGNAPLPEQDQAIVAGDA